MRSANRRDNLCTFGLIFQTTKLGSSCVSLRGENSGFVPASDHSGLCAYHMCRQLG